MKKILLYLIIIVLFGVGVVMVHNNDSISVKNQKKVSDINTDYDITMKSWKINTNPKSSMEFFQCNEDGFEFHESELSNSNYPRFIGKSKNENCEDLIVVQGNDKEFFINYSTPINDEKSLNTYSIENMKNLLKFMCPSIAKLNNMDYWEKRINEEVNMRIKKNEVTDNSSEEEYGTMRNTGEEYEIIDNSRISFYINIYSNSLVLTVEKMDSYR